MLQKRIIGVIAVENGWAVQSFGYRRTLPLGRPEFLAENLDRWGVDEIMILDFGRSRQQLGPDMDLIFRLNQQRLMTPLSYSGGISTVDQAVSVIQAGVERICIDSLLHDAPHSVIELTHQIGAQALVAALPLSLDGDNLQWYDHRHRTSMPLDPSIIALLTDGVVSEALIVDWQHEGKKVGFNTALMEAFSSQLPGVSLLLYGGISEDEQCRHLMGYSAVAALCIGNFLNYKEHAIQALKRELLLCPVRPHHYAQELI